MKKTPLNAEHRSLKAKMVDFGGWDMPVRFTSIVEEHLAVRTRAGLFDVSHMGEIWVKGPGALSLVQHLSSNDAAKLVDGQIQYTGLLTPEGCFVDDMLVYRVGEESYLLVVNASNIEKDFAWILQQRGDHVAEVINRSDETAQLAIQGPLATGILQRVLPDLNLDEIKFYRFSYTPYDGEEILVSRTGYTGEDGFEVYLSPRAAPGLWRRILEEGQPEDLQPIGLGARDTLRLEASMALYGNDIDDTTTVLEADLGWILKLAKGDFIGREPLERQKAEGISRKLIGFELLDRGIARHRYPCIHGDKEVGRVTSGTQAPFLKKAVGMAYLPVELKEPGTRFEVEIRGKGVPAEVVAKPFYKRPKKA